MDPHDHQIVITDNQYLITESLQKFLLDEFNILAIRIGNVRYPIRYY